MDVSKYLSQESIRKRSQSIARRTHNVITPANVLDVGLNAVAQHGISRLPKFSGLLEVLGARIGDLFDGWLAGWTGTPSELGEAIDAGGDWTQMLAVLRKNRQLRMLPKPIS